MDARIFQSAWNYETKCDKLGRECNNHREENPMKKAVPVTLKLEQKKLLGFRIQTEVQASDAEHSCKPGSKVGGKVGGKVGNIGAKAGSKPNSSARIGTKAGTKPTMNARIGAKVGAKPV